MKSREIKFRAIPINSNTFEYGYLFYHDNIPGIFQSGRGSLVCKVKSEGQFTGYFDRNSKEIYEGDILKTNHPIYDSWHSINEVKFIKGCWKLTYSKDDEIPLFNYKTGQLEVIGNAYQNPELL